MGIIGCATSDIVLEDVRVPAENMLGKEGQGFTNAMKTLDIGRLGIAAQSIGVAQGCLDEAIKYAKSRRQFGHAIADFQAISFMLADMATKLYAAREMTYNAAVMKDKGMDCSMECSMAKYLPPKPAMRLQQRPCRSTAATDSSRIIPLNASTATAACLPSMKAPVRSSSTSSAESS